MNNKNSDILKMLQESAKLDRTGIRMGWSNELNRHAPIVRMDFSEQELRNIIDCCKDAGIWNRCMSAISLLDRINDRLNSTD